MTRGFPARIALETSDVELLSDLVARGLGITIVPRAIAVAGATRQALRIIDIHPPITRRYTALAWNTARAHPPAAATFLTYARDWLAARTRTHASPNQRPHTNDQ